MHLLYLAKIEIDNFVLKLYCFVQQFFLKIVETIEKEIDSILVEIMHYYINSEKINRFKRLRREIPWSTINK